MSNIGYTGIVTLQLRHGKKKPYKTVEIKNNGTSTFFKILCQATIGSNMSASMPQFLGLYYVEDENEKPSSSIKLHWDNASVEQENGESYAQFQFILPGSYLSEDKINRLKLFNSLTATDPLAVLDIATPIEADTNSNLYITWKMYFGNQTITISSTPTVPTTPVVTPGTTS